MTDTVSHDTGVASASVAVETPFKRFASEFLESRIATAALAMLLFIILLAILAPWITPQNPYNLAEVDVLDGRLPPGSEAFAGYTMWLGSDGAGRDLYSGILYGLRISLSVGVTSGLIALAIGMVIGLLAAYAGGRTENFIMRIVDLQLSFPAALVARHLGLDLLPCAAGLVFEYVLGSTSGLGPFVRRQLVQLRLLVFFLRCDVVVAACVIPQGPLLAVTGLQQPHLLQALGHGRRRAVCSLEVHNFLSPVFIPEAVCEHAKHQPL